MARLLGILFFIVCAAGVAWYVAPPRAAQGYSGLEFAAMTPAATARAPLLTTRGALVYDVVPGSPAAAAGVKAGEVVAAIDENPVTSARQASDMVRGKRAGDRIMLTLFDETRGEIHARQTPLIFAAAPPLTKKLSVKPPRTLAREFFFAPPTAANAAWSRRLAHGASIRPLSFTALNAGRCAGFAPDDWTIADRDKAGKWLHLASGSSHALYKIVRLSDAETHDPRGFILHLLQTMFNSPPVATTVQVRPFGFSQFNFGTGSGTAGFAVWRMTGRVLSLWIAAVPASDAAWDTPLTAAIVFTMRCNSGLERPFLPYESALAPVTVSTRCLTGACSESDFAATYLEKFRLGYVHGADKQVYLINPRRDFWQTGPDGPGFYRQVGGSDEKLEPGLID